MNKFVKSILAVGITSALSLSFITPVNAATYQVVDTGEASQLKYTYAQSQNNAGDMAISGSSLLDFPVQFDYFDESVFTAIESYAFSNYLGVHGLEFIEDSDALRAGNPTANDLAWVIRWLQDSSSGAGSSLSFQKVGNTVAMTSIAGELTDFTLWDEELDGTDDLSRSTVDILTGITDTGIAYGTATAPYLPATFTDSHSQEITYWLREFGQRGFFSYNQGADVFELTPIEAGHSGGYSVIADVNGAGVAAGYSSYKVHETYLDYIESGGIVTTDGVESDTIRNIAAINSFVQVDLAAPADGVDDEFDEDYVIRGCNDPYILKHMPFEVCVYYVDQAVGNPYSSMAVMASLDTNGSAVIEQLGLLVTPHEDDERTYSSYALGLNNQGVAVGYADGFDDETVTAPDVDESKNYQFAVVYKNGDVIDLTGDHTDKGSSLAYDINDAGIAVGHIAKSVDGKAVQKFFYIDTSVSEESLEMIYPTDFFTGSDSTARAINNSGLIVGEGEIETHNESTSNPRRTAAFVYDLNDDIFLNLNEQIPCELRLTYDIIEARGINDLGMISATAVVKVDKRDAKGEVMLDIDGTPLSEDVVRAISLEPMPDDGAVCTAEEEGTAVVRQGASIEYSSVWFLLALFGLRRKFTK